MRMLVIIRFLASPWSSKKTRFMLASDLEICESSFSTEPPGMADTAGNYTKPPQSRSHLDLLFNPSDAFPRGKTNSKIFQKWRLWSFRRQRKVWQESPQLQSKVTGRYCLSHIVPVMQTLFLRVRLKLAIAQSSTPGPDRGLLCVCGFTANIIIVVSYDGNDMLSIWRALYRTTHEKTGVDNLKVLPHRGFWPPFFQHARTCKPEWNLTDEEAHGTYSIFFVSPTPNFLREQVPYCTCCSQIGSFFSSKKKELFFKSFIIFLKRGQGWVLGTSATPKMALESSAPGNGSPRKPTSLPSHESHGS